MEDDQRVEEWAKLIEAIGGLVTGLAWPIAVVLAVWLIMRRHNAAFGRMIDRITSLQFPGGQIDLTEAVAAQREQVDELAEQVATQDASDDERRKAAQYLVEQAAGLGQIEQSQRIAELLRSPPGVGPEAEVEALMRRMAVASAVSNALQVFEHPKWRTPPRPKDAVRPPDEDDPPAAVGARR